MPSQKPDEDIDEILGIKGIGWVMLVVVIYEAALIFAVLVILDHSIIDLCTDS